MKTLLSIIVFFSFCSVNAQNSQDTLSVYFDFNKSTLSGASNEDLMEFNTSEHMTVIRVVAHCDTSGSQAYNLKLAQKRLDAVLLKIDSTANYNDCARRKNILQSKKLRRSILPSCGHHLFGQIQRTAELN